MSCAVCGYDCKLTVTFSSHPSGENQLISIATDIGKFANLKDLDLGKDSDACACDPYASYEEEFFIIYNTLT